MTGISALTGSANTATATAAQGIADTFDTFLKLLTAQLQNQDPLSPMDSAKFTEQLVQYSQVEQQIAANDKLDTLAATLKTSTAGAALSYLGKDAIIEANQTYLAGGQANWAYDLQGSADTLTVQVKDLTGRVIYESTTQPRTAGEHLFTWDGTKTDGSTAPDGVYTINIQAKNAAGEAIAATTTVRERIMGVDFSGTTPVVITPSGTRGLDTIRSVLDGG